MLNMSFIGVTMPKPEKTATRDNSRTGLNHFIRWTSIKDLLAHLSAQLEIDISILLSWENGQQTSINRYLDTNQTQTK